MPTGTDPLAEHITDLVTVILEQIAEVRAEVREGHAQILAAIDRLER